MSTEYWEYLPKLVSLTNREFEELLVSLQEKCTTSTYTMFGKRVLSPRISCVFVPNVDKARKLAESKASFSYKQIPLIAWDSAPISIKNILLQMQESFKTKFDYVLCHIYRGGDDHIGFHNDSEALNSDIVSVSLGATRRFQIRPFKDKSGFTHEYILNNGDVIRMKGPNEEEGIEKGCQRLYKHCVPKMNGKDLVRHLQNEGIELPKEKKTKKVLHSLIDDNNVPPVRINLTFRCFE